MNHFGLAMGVMTVGVLGGAVLMDQHFKHDGKAVGATKQTAVAQSKTPPTSVAPAIDVANNDASMPAPTSSQKMPPEKTAAKTTAHRTETVSAPVAEQKAVKSAKSATAAPRTAHSSDGNAGTSVASTASAPSATATPDSTSQATTSAPVAADTASTSNATAPSAVDTPAVASSAAPAPAAIGNAVNDQPASTLAAGSSGNSDAASSGTNSTQQ